MSIMNSLRKSLASPSVRRGLAMGIVMVGGVASLKAIQDLKFLTKSRKEITDEEAEAIFKKYNVKKEDFQDDVAADSEQKWLDSRDLNSWQNIRGPRPWEDSKSIQSELKNRASGRTDDTADTPEAQAAARARKEKRRRKMIKDTLESCENWKQDSQKILDDYVGSTKTGGRVDEQYLNAFRHSQKMLEQLTIGSQLKTKFTDMINAGLEEDQMDEDLEKVKEANKELVKLSNRLRTAMMETWKIQDLIRRSKR